MVILKVSRLIGKYINVLFANFIDWAQKCVAATTKLFARLLIKLLNKKSFFII